MRGFSTTIVGIALLIGCSATETNPNTSSAGAGGSGSTSATSAISSSATSTTTASSSASASSTSSSATTSSSASSSSASSSSSGGCGGGPCGPTILGTGLPNATGIAVDANNVYVTVWTQSPTGKVISIPIAGGAQTLLAGGQTQALSIAVDATHAYWIDGEDGSGMGPSGLIQRVPLQGGNPTSIALKQTFPIDIHVHGSSVYWAEMGMLAAQVDGHVRGAPIGGGNAQTLATAQILCAMTVDDTSAYYAGCNGPTAISSVPLAGGNPTTLATAAGNPFSIAVGNDAVYWTEYGGSIWRVPLAGGMPVLIASGEITPTSIVVQNNHLYWVKGTDLQNPTGGIIKADLDGKNRQTLVSQGVPSHIAVDAQNVYWTDPVAGAVLKAPN